ncbi:MAG: hypothetical protein KC506_00530, partial [Nanoarchaeota archaeon]|nr:hypothetical protein [Nanoarchaeota archaeon]
MNRKGDSNPTGIIISLVLLAFLIIIGIFATTSYGKNTLEQLKPLLGIKQEIQIEEGQQTISYNIEKNTIEYYDGIKWISFEKEGKVKLGNKEIEYAPTKETFQDFFYTRELPKEFSWINNGNSGTLGRTYTKPRGFSVEAFSSS